ncbi:unnamed protein product, partial [Ectocarpus sp. 8 AP-2014]
NVISAVISALFFKFGRVEVISSCRAFASLSPGILRHLSWQPSDHAFPPSSNNAPCSASTASPFGSGSTRAKCYYRRRGCFDAERLAVTCLMSEFEPRPRPLSYCSSRLRLQYTFTYI